MCRRTSWCAKAGKSEVSHGWAHRGRTRLGQRPMLLGPCQGRECAVKKEGQYVQFRLPARRAHGVNTPNVSPHFSGLLPDAWGPSAGALPDHRSERRRSLSAVRSRRAGLLDDQRDGPCSRRSQASHTSSTPMASIVSLFSRWRAKTLPRLKAFSTVTCPGPYGPLRKAG